MSSGSSEPHVWDTDHLGGSPDHFGAPDVTPYTDSQYSATNQPLLQFPYASEYARPAVRELRIPNTTYATSNTNQQPTYSTLNTEPVTDLDPPYGIKENNYHVDQHSRPIAAWSHQDNIHGLFSADHLIIPKLHTIPIDCIQSGERGWYVYRRNFISVQCHYALEPLPDGQPLQVDLEGELKTIKALGLRLRVTGEGTTHDDAEDRDRSNRPDKKMELIQFTSLREKGALFEPTVIKAAPIDNTLIRMLTAERHERSSAHMKYPPPTVGPHLPLQHLPEAACKLRKVPEGVSDMRQPESDGAGPTHALRKFHHLQFARATKNNGDRKPNQEWFRIVVELVADIREGDACNPDWIAVACHKSPPLMVRGRSPNNFKQDFTSQPFELPSSRCPPKEPLKSRDRKQPAHVGRTHQKRTHHTRGRADGYRVTKTSVHNSRVTGSRHKASRRVPTSDHIARRSGPGSYAPVCDSNCGHCNICSVATQPLNAVNYQADPTGRRFFDRPDTYYAQYPYLSNHTLSHDIGGLDDATDYYSRHRPEHSHQLPGLVDFAGHRAFPTPESGHIYTQSLLDPDVSTQHDLAFVFTREENKFLLGSADRR